ncbi:MAG: MFS transporter [Chitinophagaceae bacterium]|nr:MFS transporter [Chitinophagaceae bacterium]
MKIQEAKPIQFSGNIDIQPTVFPILFAISFSHLLNDTIQSIIPSIYPQLKESFSLNFVQVGLITLTFQMAASLLQPLVGMYTDKKPQPFSLAIGMTFTLTGLVMLAYVTSFSGVLISVGLIGVGSSVFHPEASKVAYMAAGPRRGLAQSIFQVGGNAGSAIGPLLAAFIILPLGRHSISWFSIIALLAIFVLWRVGIWYSASYLQINRRTKRAIIPHHLPKSKIVLSIIILLLLIFSKFFYMTGISSYFTFYVMDRFGVSVQQSQLYLFIFLAAVAIGTVAGGPIGDRIGRKYVIWVSILGVAPFSLVLPYASLLWTGILIFIIGLILASAFSSILVYAQELLPGKIGMVSGLFFGFAFGMGGIGSALLGKLADITSIEYVYKVCSFLPLIGLFTGFLPNLKQQEV